MQRAALIGVVVVLAGGGAWMLVDDQKVQPIQHEDRPPDTAYVCTMRLGPQGNCTMPIIGLEDLDLPLADRLLGKWVSADSTTSVDFRSDGRLDYTTHWANQDKHTNLIYRVEGDILVTEHPSNPGEERTHVVFTDDGRLMLWFDGRARHLTRS